MFEHPEIAYRLHSARHADYVRDAFAVQTGSASVEVGESVPGGMSIATVLQSLGSLLRFRRPIATENVVA